MGRAGYNVREIRFIIGDELTEAFFLLEALGDCPMGVQGWHHKTFPPSVAVLDIIQAHGRGEDDPVLWPLDAPG